MLILDISGGGSVARYFVSASYVSEGGMYKTDDKLKDYNTNANLSALELSYECSIFERLQRPPW